MANTILDVISVCRFRYAVNNAARHIFAYVVGRINPSYKVNTLPHLSSCLHRYHCVSSLRSLFLIMVVILPDGVANLESIIAFLIIDTIALILRVISRIQTKNTTTTGRFIRYDDWWILAAYLTYASHCMLIICDITKISGTLEPYLVMDSDNQLKMLEHSLSIRHHSCQNLAFMHVPLSFQDNPISYSLCKCYNGSMHNMVYHYCLHDLLWIHTYQSRI